MPCEHAKLSIGIHRFIYQNVFILHRERARERKREVGGTCKPRGVVYYFFFIHPNIHENIRK